MNFHELKMSSYSSRSNANTHAIAKSPWQYAFGMPESCIRLASCTWAIAYWLLGSFREKHADILFTHNSCDNSKVMQTSLLETVWLYIHGRVILAGSAESGPCVRGSELARMETTMPYPMSDEPIKLSTYT